MKNNYNIVKRVTEDEWLQICKVSKTATFFHTPYWAMLFENSNKRCKANATGFIFENQLKAILPSVTKKYFYSLLKSTSIMPATTFGGWISKTELKEEEDKAIIIHLQQYNNLIMRENPYNPLKFTPDKLDSIEDFTWVINLEKGYKEAWKNSTDGHRNAVRNAIRKKVEVIIGEEEEQWKEYYEIYLQSIKRWKEKKMFRGVKYNLNFFLEIKKLNSSLRKLWLATINNKYIAGILCFYWNNHCVVWHGTALKEYFSYYPNNLLYDRAIEDAATNGFIWFDCNPSGGIKGVNNFKKYLGAKQMQSRVFVRYSPLLKIINYIRYFLKGMEI